MGDKTWLAFMQKVRSHPKTERKSKEQIMNMITVDQETLMRMIAQAVEAEREACAKVCESEAEMFKSCAYGANDGRYDWKEDGARECATAIRARGNT
jgi:isopenicillin N synthase-like dioxygenase